MDIFDKEKRSQIMRSVKSKNNKTTEIKFLKLLKNYNITGWRRNYPVNGKPDIVFLKNKLAIFIDGCFWHGHNCRNTKPKQNKDYWDEKIKQNKRRDKRITEMFQNRNWKVFRIWECDLTKKPEKIITLLQQYLK